MSFIANKNAPAKSTAPAPANGREPRTTIGYVNLSIPMADGSRKKIGNDVTIRLYAENLAHQDLIDLIRAHSLDSLEAGQAVQVEINVVEPVDPDAERPMPAFFANLNK